jgi:hypothetical protein
LAKPWGADVVLLLLLEEAGETAPEEKRSNWQERKKIMACVTGRRKEGKVSSSLAPLCNARSKPGQQPLPVAARHFPHI